jgi:hypothetical protein
VVFRPGGTAPFVAAPARELSDADVPLDVLWGRQRERLLREQLLSACDPESALDVLEAALLDRCREKAAHPAVRYALSEFRAHPSIARIRAVTDAIALSPKRFIERFKAGGRRHPKAVLPAAPVPARRGERAPSRPGGLGWARAGVRLFRPGPPDPRLPRVLGADADRLRSPPHGVPEPRHIFTIHGTVDAGQNAGMPDTIATYRTLTPYLVVPDADAEMHFLTTAFGATEVSCQRNGDGTVMHAELRSAIRS